MIKNQWNYTYISTLSTLTPQGSVASSKDDCMMWEMVSLSDKISAKFFVPRTFRRVVAASKRVEWLNYIENFNTFLILQQQSLQKQTKLSTPSSTLLSKHTYITNMRKLFQDKKFSRWKFFFLISTFSFWSWSTLYHNWEKSFYNSKWLSTSEKCHAHYKKQYELRKTLIFPI